MRIRIPVSIILMAVISIGSLCPKDEETEITGSVSFTFLPVELDAIFRATPLGNTNPPGHVFPTNHIGFYLNGTDPGASAGIPVRLVLQQLPAAGI